MAAPTCYIICVFVSSDFDAIEYTTVEYQTLLHHKILHFGVKEVELDRLELNFHMVKPTVQSRGAPTERIRKAVDSPDIDCDIDLD